MEEAKNIQGICLELRDQLEARRLAKQKRVEKLEEVRQTLADIRQCLEGTMPGGKKAEALMQQVVTAGPPNEAGAPTSVPTSAPTEGAAAAPAAPASAAPETVGGEPKPPEEDPPVDMASLKRRMSNSMTDTLEAGKFGAILQGSNAPENAGEKPKAPEEEPPVDMANLRRRMSNSFADTLQAGEFGAVLHHEDVKAAKKEGR